ncbi:hypothetical protein QAD02_008685 [Eretmocerus hayati]|uniref:Uncharacterized protein n=1 Tax=Eretmocerus hayati TaxID=131215 RepID=A0ACC2N8F6_9HYME|nr:hypothetical protein QAD02_008685 [Eretmocerus hayati]
MSDGRRRESGSFYRKRAAEKDKKNEEVISKTPRIQSFFKSELQASSNCNIVVQENLQGIITQEERAVQRPVAGGDDLQVEPSTSTATETTNKIECQDEEIQERSSAPAKVKLNKDPFFWPINDSTRDYIVKYGYEQNEGINFEKSRRTYESQTRYFSGTLFERHLKNGETKHRDWLIYSQSTGNVYCGPCLAFNGSSKFASKEGFSDWRNPKNLGLHEESDSHKNIVAAINQRRSCITQIDKQLTQSLDIETRYWYEVMRRCVSAIKKLVSRGLPTRGHTEKFGCIHNGNYMMSLELLAEWDPFLAKHISDHGNRGSGHTNYLSSTICDELILLMAAEVIEMVVRDIKDSLYYSVIVDSTPDIAHIDQLTFIIRCILSDAEACVESCQFFNLLQELNNVFVHSTDRWGDLSIQCQAHRKDQQQQAIELCETDQIKISRRKNAVKTLSATRWSARCDSVVAVETYWDALHATLNAIEADKDTKSLVRCQVIGVRVELERLETAFLVKVWGFLLPRIDSVSKRLQAQDIEITTVVELYDSLIGLVSSIRNDESFQTFLSEALIISINEDYDVDLKRKKKKTKKSDESNSEETLFTGEENLRVNVYFMILDSLLTELKRRCVAYRLYADKFEWMLHIENMSLDEIRNKAMLLVQSYPDDLEDGLVKECIHFKAHISSSQRAGATREDHRKNLIELLKWIRKNEYHSIYPNIEIVLRICVSTANSPRCSSQIQDKKILPKCDIGMKKVLTGFYS